MPKITLKNLYNKDTGKCRFCGATKNEKHGQFYHGIGDLLGYNTLDIEYVEVEKNV